jgi:hypothetical protein
MDRDVARREILLLGAGRWTRLWEPVAHLTAIDQDLGQLDIADLVVDTLRSLADRGSLKFVRAGYWPPTADMERHRLGRAQIAQALTSVAVQSPGDVWFSATRNGERELAALLGVKLAGRRRKAFGRVVAGFAVAVQAMVHRHRPRDGGFEGSDNDDDAGLAGSGVPRRPPDRSGSGAAIATPEPDYDFERIVPPEP